MSDSNQIMNFFLIQTMKDSRVLISIACFFIIIATVSTTLAAIDKSPENPELGSNIEQNIDKHMKSWFVPFSHSQIGISMGFTTMDMQVSNTLNDIPNNEVATSRYSWGFQVRPLAFLSFKGAMSNSNLSDITQSNGIHNIETKFNADFNCYSAEANLIVPVFFWNDGLESLLCIRKGLYFSIGGSREWINLSDSYSKDSLGVSLKMPLAKIEGTLNETRWVLNAGVFYRFLFRRLPKAHLEIGLEYSPLYDKKLVAFGTTIKNSLIEPISGSLSTAQTIPLRFNASILFDLY